MIRATALLFLVILLGCTAPQHVAPPTYSHFVPPFPPRALAARAPMAVIAQTNVFYNPPHYRVVTLPEFRVPKTTNVVHWLLERSPDMVHWEGVSAWSKGYGREILLQGANCFMRLRSCVPLPPYTNAFPDTNPNDL